VSDRVNCDRVSLDREQHAPITDAQTHSANAFECFHVARTGCRERRYFEINLRAPSGGKLSPLAGGSGSKRDFLRISDIA
jgi:hypothetical protein